MPGVVPLADRVDEDERAVAVEQPVGQVHAADADVGDLDAGRQVAPGAAGAPPRRRTRRRRGRRCRRRRRGPRFTRSRHLELVGVEVAEPAVRDLQLGGRVAVDGDRDVHLAVDVVQHRVHGGRAGRRGTGPARRRPGRGRSSTRLPLATGVPPTRTESVSGSTEASAPGPTTARRSRRRRRPGRRGRRRRRAGAAAAMRIAPCRRSQISGGIASTASTTAAARGSVARASRLLLVGEHQRAQAEDLVDLGAVEQVRRALRGELRVVGEDDRRRQQQVRALRRPGEHRPGVLGCPAAASRGAPTRGGSVAERNAPAVDGEQGVRGDQRRPQRDLARGAVGAGGVVDDVDAQPQARRRARAAARRRRRAARSAARQRRSTRPPVTRSLGVLRGQREGHGRARPAGRRRPRRRPAAGTPSSHGKCRSSPSTSSSTGRPSVSWTDRARSCRNRSRRCSDARRRGVRAAPRCGSGPARAGEPGGVSTPNCQRSRFFCAEAR